MPKKVASSAGRQRYDDGALTEAARKRAQHATIRRYLEAIEERNYSSNSRAVDPQRLEARLRAVNAQLTDAAPVDRVRLIQERLNLEARLGTDEGTALHDLERAFIAVVAEWAERKGISYIALRQAGVPARVLRAAAVPRSRSTA